MVSRRSFLAIAGAATAGLVLPRRASAAFDRIGVQLYSVRDQMEKDFTGTLERVARIGFRDVEFAGYFDRFPDLKIIVHHLGGMVPHFAGRIGGGLDQLGTRTDDEDLTVHSRRL